MSDSAKQAELQELKGSIWSWDQYWDIVEALERNGLKRIKDRDEYTLFREYLSVEELAEVSNFPQDPPAENTQKKTQNALKSTFFPQKKTLSKVVSIRPMGTPKVQMTLSPMTPSKTPFLAPFDVQQSGSIADNIDSFGVIQSDRLSLNIGFDTEFQDSGREDSAVSHRHVLSLQMSISVGGSLIRYFFLIDPRYQKVSADGGMIPLKYCLADILNDLKWTFASDLPLVRRENIVYKNKEYKGHEPFKVIDTKAMKNSIIPVSLVCHTGKADISVFRRGKYDVDLLRKLSEVQGGWMTAKMVPIKAENDQKYHYYWILNLSVRDTLGLTPAENKSLKALGNVINRPKIELPKDAIKHMSSYALQNPVGYYDYAMNDADIVVLFCSELFRRNHAIPMTLSSAAASAMYGSIKDYFGVSNKADFDRIYRGLEMLDEGIIPSKDECLKFLKATRYVPIRDNPDAKLVSEYFEEAYTGGFNASFYLGWITEQTTDYDLQNAYPTAMANIVDIDWSRNVRDFPRNYVLSWQDLTSPLIPAVAVGDFDFPDTCYCPNIPVPVKGGLKIYPRHAKNVYMTGPDMYLALKLGAKITIFRGFTCMMLQTNDGKPSQCLAYAVSSLVQDRMLAKSIYPDKPLVEKSLKTMVNSCYGKTAQNVSPKTRYNARIMGREDSEPSTVTSPYHAAYTTALVRCMLIACINQLHDLGYRVYSVTTDGFITNAPTNVIRNLDAYGFASIFQQGRYILNQSREDCEANQVWEPKHYNDVFLNITTRGNVAVNDKGVLAHNSYTTGEVKDSRADRDAYIIAVLTREGRLKCPTKVWTEFSEIVERKHDFHVVETMRQLSMDFDYKRCPVLETAVDTAVHYDSADGSQHIDTVIAEFDTRPFDDAEEFLNYRCTMHHEECVKVKADLERVKVKSTVKAKGYVGRDLNRKMLLSILMGYRSGLYQIPVLDGLKQSEIVAEINSWNIAEISVNDWKNCSRTKRQENMLPRDVIEDTLQKILVLSSRHLDEKKTAC